MSIDLKKIISNVVEEGFMEAPKKVIQPIIDYYLERLKEFRRLGREKMSQQFGDRNFELDFSDTPYEFLNSPRKKNLLVKLSNGSKSFASDGGGYIQLDFSDPLRGITDVTEHEILHVMQSGLKGHIEGKSSFQKHRSKFKRPEGYGGLPKDKFVKRSTHPDPSHPNNPSTLFKITKDDPVAYGGYITKKVFKDDNIGRGGKIIRDKSGRSRFVKAKPKKGEEKLKGYTGNRTKHQLRPVELYPDLLSSVRDLQVNFQKSILNLDVRDKKLMFNSKELRKKYLKAFIDQQKEIEVPSENGPVKIKVFNHLAKWAFDKWKDKLPKSLYNDFLRLTYDAFVNRDAPFDYEELKTKIDEIITIDKEQQQAKKEIQAQNLESGKLKASDFKFFKDSLREEYPDDLFPIMDDIEVDGKLRDFYDEKFPSGRIEPAENILGGFGFQSPKYDRDDNNQGYFLTTKYSEIIKAFKGLKKDRIQAEQGSDGYDLPPEFYDKLKEDIKERYLNALRGEDRVRNAFIKDVDIAYSN
jgi:hypothetical protein